MPDVEFELPNGEIIELEVDRIPSNLEEQEDLFNRVMQQRSQQQVPQDPEDPLTPQEQERQLDIQEDRLRPTFPEAAKSAISGARREIGDILELGKTFIQNPIQSSKAILKSVKSITPENTKDFAIDLAKDFGRTIGFDIDRPGSGLDKFDVDTLIDRWKNQPIAALGDLLIFNGAAKGVLSTTKKAGNKIAMNKAIKRSGNEISDMAKDMAEAKKKAISRGANIPIISPGENVALKADAIKKIPLKSLNSPQFPRKTSVDLSNRIFELGKRENKRMNNALNKVANQQVNTGRLGETVKKELIDGGFADNIKDAVDVAIEGAKSTPGAVNVITPLNKGKLNQFLDILDSGKQIPVKELKNIMDVIDDSINYVNTRASDGGLRIMRKAIRKELGSISPEYDKIASRIADRLTELGYAERKIRRGAKEGFLREYKEKVGLEIIKSEERTTAFKKAMNIVGDETAGAALGKFELIDGWKAWNDLYNTNQSVFKFQGNIPSSIIRGAIDVSRKGLRKQFPGIDIGSGLRGVGANIGVAARRTSTGFPKAATLAEGLIEE